MNLSATEITVWDRLKARAKHALSGSRGDVVFKGLTLSVTLCILALAALMVSEVVAGARESIRTFGVFGFLSSTAWNPVTKEFGALHVIVGTLVSSFIAVLLAVPVALGIAIFVTQMAPPRIGGAIAFLIDILAAIPSIVYGLWGFFVMVPWIRSSLGPFLIGHLGWLPLFRGPSFGVSVLAAGFILAVMIIPIISAVAREVISQVPQAQKEGMIALGATSWDTIWRVVLPYARAGILGAVILGLARALGETMAVTMIIGNAHRLTWSLLQPNSTMASIIANEFTEATYTLYISALIHVGLVLMVIALIVNVLARLLVWSVARAPAGEVR